MTGQPLLSVRGLRKRFPLGQGWSSRVMNMEALDGIDLEVRMGEVVGIVGESGSGKTTLGRCVVRLVEPTSGEIRFNGRDLQSLSGRDLRRTRRRLQIVFQDPYGSLNPRLSVGQIVREPLEVHRIVPAGSVTGRVRDLLETVGLEASFAARYPHELSGGQRQRVAIARALAPQPDLIVADEPVSALDVSVQAQILEIFDELKGAGEVAMLFISHDLAVVERLADRVAVMYRGRIVEQAATQALIRNPRHPYTKALLSAVPDADPRLRRERVRLRPPTGRLHAPDSECPLARRCPLVDDVCHELDPALEEVSAGHLAACHFASNTRT